MKILLYRWEIYPYHDILNTLKKQGHQVDVLVFPLANQTENEAFTKLFSEKMAQPFDLVFSVNYFAAIGHLCHRYQIPYASWCCDAPLLAMLHPSVFYPTNYIFTFDKKEQERLLKKGVSHAYYLPLAGICLQKCFDLAKQKTDDAFYSYDISFVGNLYDRNRYEDMCIALPNYLCGYMDAAIEAQKKVTGGNLLPSMLDNNILTDVMQYTHVVNGSSSLEELRLHFATAVLSYKVAADMRSDLLNFLADFYQVHLFTTSRGTQLKKQIQLHPAVDYHTQMPDIFLHSKINLNLTIPNIENGIPLRVFDILSSGGFLLTDYREEICNLFTDGIDLVIYDGMEDLKKKTDYYLSHPEERTAIAKSGQKKVQRLHSYEKRILQILHTIFPEG